MTSRQGIFLSIAALLQLLIAGPVRADDDLALTERLNRAIVSNSIDGPDMKPWHLKLSFQLFDAKGAPTEKGTIEEWWAGPSMQKTVYSSPSYSSTEVRTKDGLYRSKGAGSIPSLLQLVEHQVVHPMPSREDISDSKPDLRKDTVGKVAMDCIMLAQQIKNVAYAPLGLFPTYCLDRDKDSLRASYDFGSLLIVRNRLGSFQNSTVAIDQSFVESSITEATAHIDALQSTAISEGDFVPSSDLENVPLNHASVAPGVMAGLKTAGVNPHYPETSRRNHVSGSVILRARIGTDGHIHSLRVVSTPAADLALASLAAVRSWTYKPYLLNGEPVDVDTQITVNFAFGSP